MTMNALEMPHMFRAASRIRTIALATILALVATFAVTNGAQAVEEVNIKGAVLDNATYLGWHYEAKTLSLNGKTARPSA